MVAQQIVPREGLPVQPVCLNEQAADGQPDDLLPHCLSPQAQVVAAQSDSDDQDTELEPIAAGRSLQQGIERKKNITAADLQVSWNDLKSLSTRAGFRSLTTDQAKAAKKAVFVRLRAVHADNEGTTTPLHTVTADSINILGEQNGVTYGTWKSGPAGTLPIRNYYRAHDVESPSRPSKDFMVVLRRSAKIWSKRLVDDGQRHDVTLLDGKKVKNVPGIVLQIRLHNNAMSAAVLSYNHDKDKKIYRPYNGRMRVTLNVHNNLHDGQANAVAHEIGHVLGIGTGTRLFSEYYDAEDHTWSGPNAMRENGGEPVPLQWVGDNNRWWLTKEPHAPDAQRDLGHIGLCVSIMSYCNNRYIGGSPSELDFAFLADIGFKLVDAAVASKPERYGHLSWGEWAVWGASVERDLQNNFHEGYDDNNPHDFVQAHATAFGAAPATTLANNPALSGSVVWKGSVVGVDLGKERLPPVVGKAKLSVDLATLSGTAHFTDLTIHIHGNNVLKRRGSTKPFRKSQLDYAINVTGNDFAAGDDNSAWKLSGSFYGPSHQEMAGVLKDTRPGVNLLAGFGGIQTDE